MYEIGDILLIKPEVRRNTEVIVIGLNLTRPKNKYQLRINKPNRITVYCGSDDMIDRKVGHVESDHPFLVEAKDKVEKVVSQGDLWAIDKYVRSLNRGDTILIERSGRVQRHTFCRYLHRGRVYKFTSTNPNGTTYKWALKDVKMPA